MSLLSCAARSLKSSTNPKPNPRHRHNKTCVGLLLGLQGLSALYLQRSLRYSACPGTLPRRGLSTVTDDGCWIQGGLHRSRHHPRHLGRLFYSDVSQSLSSSSPFASAIAPGLACGTTTEEISPSPSSLATTAATNRLSSRSNWLAKSSPPQALCLSSTSGVAFITTAALPQPQSQSQSRAQAPLVGPAVNNTKNTSNSPLLSLPAWTASPTSATATIATVTEPLATTAVSSTPRKTPSTVAFAALPPYLGAHLPLDAPSFGRNITTTTLPSSRLASSSRPVTPALSLSVTPQTFSSRLAILDSPLFRSSPLSSSSASLCSDLSSLSSSSSPSFAHILDLSRPPLSHPPTRVASLLSSSSAHRRPSPLAAAIVTMSAIQTRTHGGHHHHHHHHHHHDNIYLTSKDKNDAGVRITRIGLLSNLGMAIAKGIGGYAFNSHAMVADAYHSVTDLASDILTLATVSWSLKEPTHDYPTGFGKVESLGSLGVSGMLLTGGLLMCWSSFVALLEQIGLDPAALGGILAHAHDHGHSHSHSHGSGGPSLHAAWLAAGTIAIKEWLYHKTMAVARARKSSVLASNAIHHRVDSLTGVVTLAVILASNWFTNAEWLDSVGGLLISILVIKAGAENTIAAVSELADRAIDTDTASSVRKYSLRVLQDLEPGHGLEIREVGGVKSGQNYLIDIEVAVPLSWTIEKMRTIEDAVRFQIGSRVRGAKRVRVRFVPVEGVEQKSFDEFVPGDVTPRESTPEPEEHDHDDHDHKHSNGKSGKE